MIKLIKGGVYYMEGTLFKERDAFMVEAKKQKAIKSTMAYKILKAHNKGDDENLKIKFDALASHDITYVGIIQTAKASGLQRISPFIYPHKLP